jgi:16S rRNA (cytosine1402-N4)-methyltransferase
VREAAGADLTTSSPDKVHGADFSHVTVLREEVTDAVARATSGLATAWVVDCTLGGGGHSEAILRAVPQANVLGLDRDPDALAAATARLAGFGPRFQAVHTPFAGLASVVAARGLGPVHAIVADLGVSSHQFDTPARGFSLRHDGPLDMRMDPTTGLSLAERLEHVTVEELADVLYAYGDIRRSIGTARIVLQAVQEGADTTAKLAQKLASRLDRDRNVHPATMVFQALRIWVNGELDELATLLRDAPGLLQEGGVLAVISFHSGEDRLVKQAMRELAPKKYGPFMRGKPMTAGDEEVRMNPRARSARLRLLWRARAGVDEGGAPDGDDGDDF